MTEPKTIYVRAIDLERLGIQIAHWSGDDPKLKQECAENAELIAGVFGTGFKIAGEVGTMPGTDGFTMAAFKADEVPVGTKLFYRKK